MSCSPHGKRTLQAMPATWATAEQIAKGTRLKRQMVAQALGDLMQHGYVTQMVQARGKPTLWIITEAGIAHRDSPEFGPLGRESAHVLTPA